MIPTKTVEELIMKHSNLEKDLSSGEIDKKLFAEKSKEYSDVNEIIKNAKDYISFQTEKEELDKILNDSAGDEELKKLAELELLELQNRHEINEKKLKLFLLPKDEAYKKNALIEIGSQLCIAEGIKNIVVKMDNIATISEDDLSFDTILAII